MTTEPVTLDARWTPCGRGRGHYCVVDGDTIRIGSERVRILGLDTPEIEGRCDGESALALRAKERMLRWLNAGRVTTRTRIDRPRDQYGRQLREVYRHFPDGSREYAADVLVADGLARPYNGGSRGGWC
ncbi:thermonuclease family protein [Qipengyuania flava]|uniref:thermonuclease family protein n=1 Tax=Qipengyuania flava TaxID=192812 RepID=UPI001C62AE7A|nr:thermonuclease family protein [Qipengyuania flava]QYJ07564.1 thermonuclease family protein [Qipengyuania flava]